MTCLFAVGDMYVKPGQFVFACKSNVAGFLIFLTCIFLCQFLFAQKKILFIDDELISIEDSLQLEKILKRQVDIGYLFASIDLISKSDDTVKYRLYKGGTHKSNFRKIATNNPVAKGYPFIRNRIVKTKIKSPRIIFDTTSLLGPYIEFDSLFLINPIDVKDSYLYNVIGFEPGDIYSETVFLDIATKINLTNQLTLKNPPDIGFDAGKARVILNLKNTSTDEFEGVIGFLPSRNNKLSITGFLKLYLNNILKRGIQLRTDWQRPSPLTQSLNLFLANPFFFGTNIDVASKFHIFKQDSLFQRNSFQFELLSPLHKHVRLGIGLGRATNVSYVDDALSNSYDQIFVSTKLVLGNEPSSDNYDNGLGATLELIVGDKKIQKNQSKQIGTSTVNFRLTNHKRWNQGILTRTEIVFNRLQSGLILQNELPRTGGFNSFRGVNEYSILSRSHIIFLMDQRIYFTNTSFFSLLTDYGYFKNENRFSLFSIGLGLSFKTDNGIFKFILANELIQNKTWVNSKVHFGYEINF